MSVAPAPQSNLERFAYWINSRWRKLDFYWNRTYGGLWQKIFGAEGFAPATYILLFPILLTIIVGPTFSRIPSANIFLLLVVVLAIAYWGIRFFGKSRSIFDTYLRFGLIEFEAALILATCLVVWLCADADAREWQPGLYRHTYIILIAVIILVLLIVPRFLARLLLDGYTRASTTLSPSPWPKMLEETELFVVPPPHKFTGLALFRSLFTSTVHNFLQLLFPAAIILLLVPHNWMWWTLYIALGFTALVLALAGVHERLNAMLRLTRRAFFVGMPLLLSCSVIVLATLRLVEFSYVSIILESTRINVVLLCLLIGYVTLLFYEAWTAHLLCERLLALFDKAGGQSATRLKYEFQRPLPAQTGEVNVFNENQFLQIHGGRFAVVGRFKNKQELEDDVWETYDRPDLFEHIARMRHHGIHSAKLTMAYGIGDLRRRIQFYHVFVTILSFGLLGIGLYMTRDPNVPVVHIPVPRPAENLEAAPHNGPKSLSDRLFVSAAANQVPASGANGQKKRRHVILVASSGGGTRAALYATSVFEGIQQLNALDDTVLHSGVSGGSLAIAYLQIHHNELVAKNCRSQWDHFYEVMSAPFIDDVMHGAVEWRLFGETRLSALLSESFNRRLEPAKFSNPTTIGKCPDTVIFNSTLAASRTLGPQGDWQPFTSKFAGGRLIFTNLPNNGAFPKEGDPNAPDEFLKYVVVNDALEPVHQAAACSANFPPVFPNVGVLVDNNQEFWITDGGAADNRGIESLLLALQKELSDQKTKSDLNELPIIHVVVAEASALSSASLNDRGVGSALGASGKFASQLMLATLDDCRTAYGKLVNNGDDAFRAKVAKESLQLHYLAMPPFFRSNGGLGTHWMLQRSVTLAKPVPGRKDNQETVTVSGRTAMQLIRALHQPERFDEILEGSNDKPTVLQRIKQWINEDDHSKAWEKFKEELTKQ